MREEFWAFSNEIKTKWPGVKISDWILKYAFLNFDLLSSVCTLSLIKQHSAIIVEWMWEDAKFVASVSAVYCMRFGLFQLVRFLSLGF